MPLIFRATKAGSTDGNYVPNVIIQSAEVNLDFNELYDLVDGALDNVNIAAAAGIAYTKLNLVNGISTADLQDNSVITQKIAPLAVSTARLSINATVANNVVGSVTSGLLITTAGVTVLDTPTFTSRGSAVLLMGSMCATCTMGGTTVPLGVFNTLSVAVFRGTPGPVFTPVASFSINASLRYVTDTAAWGFPTVVPFSLIDSPPAGAGVFYRVSAQATAQSTVNPISNWTTAASDAGFLSALQLA